jgi:hypothetical protein
MPHGNLSECCRHSIHRCLELPRPPPAANPTSFTDIAFASEESEGDEAARFSGRHSSRRSVEYRRRCPQPASFQDLYAYDIHLGASPPSIRLGRWVLNPEKRSNLPDITPLLPRHKHTPLTAVTAGPVPNITQRLISPPPHPTLLTSSVVGGPLIACCCVAPSSSLIGMRCFSGRICVFGVCDSIRALRFHDAPMCGAIQK